MQGSNERNTGWKRMAAAGVVAGFTAVLAGAAFAGECPAASRVADGKGQPMGPTMPKDVTDMVRASTDLSKEPAKIDGRQFRLRELQMMPGGVVPWHSHDDRPALIYVAIGEVTEYASSCAVPIVHHPGEVAMEQKGTSHWWKNTGDSTVVLISADLLHKQDHDDAMM